MRNTREFADTPGMSKTTQHRSKKPDEWPLGTLLREARGKMSIREAARRAGISEARWRQVEAGVQRVGGAVDIPVNPKPETVAAMCHAINADAAEGLRLAGLDPEHYPHLVVSTVAELPDEVRNWFMRLPRADRDAVIGDLQRLAASAELDGLRDHG